MSTGHEQMYFSGTSRTSNMSIGKGKLMKMIVIMVGKGEESKIEEINGGRKKRGEEEESREEMHSRNVQKVNSMLSKTRFALTRKVTKFSPDSSELLFSSSTNKGTKWSVKAPIR